MISMGPDLCSRILHGPYPSVLFHRLDLCRGILHNLYWGNLRGLYGLDLCPCIFLGRPGFELLQQGFGCWLTDLGLILIGRHRSRSNFVARRRFRCSRRQVLSAGD